jgi:hypothetical protein
VHAEVAVRVREVHLDGDDREPASLRMTFYSRLTVGRTQERISAAPAAYRRKSLVPTSGAWTTAHVGVSQRIAESDRRWAAVAKLPVSI